MTSAASSLTSTVAAAVALILTCVTSPSQSQGVMFFIYFCFVRYSTQLSFTEVSTQHVRVIL